MIPLFTACSTHLIAFKLIEAYGSQKLAPFPIPKGLNFSKKKKKLKQLSKEREWGKKIRFFWADMIFVTQRYSQSIEPTLIRRVFLDEIYAL